MIQYGPKYFKTVYDEISTQYGPSRPRTAQDSGTVGALAQIDNLHVDVELVG